MLERRGDEGRRKKKRLSWLDATDERGTGGRDARKRRRGLLAFAEGRIERRRMDSKEVSFSERIKS